MPVDLDRVTLFDRDKVLIPHRFVFKTWRYPGVTPLGECSYLRDDDDVLVLEIEDGIRGYPAVAIESHHIVQDRIGSREVLITF